MAEAISHKGAGRIVALWERHSCPMLFIQIVEKRHPQEGQVDEAISHKSAGRIVGFVGEAFMPDVVHPDRRKASSPREDNWMKPFSTIDLKRQGGFRGCGTVLFPIPDSRFPIPDSQLRNPGPSHIVFVNLETTFEIFLPAPA